MNKLSLNLFILLEVISQSGVIKSAIITVKNQTIQDDKSLIDQSVFDIIKHCLMQTNKLNCFKKQTILVIDRAIKNNETWHLNDYITIESNPLPPPVILNGRNLNVDVESTHHQHTNVDKNLMSKIEDLVHSKYFRFGLRPPTIPSLIDEGTKCRGRKKKNKHNNMIMMGGVAIAALLAQLFLGKIAFLAGIALVLAKIALLFSTMSSFKKYSHGGHGTEHVWTENAGHGGYGGGGNSGSGSGWQRSLNKQVTTTSGPYIDYRDNESIDSGHGYDRNY